MAWLKLCGASGRPQTAGCFSAGIGHSSSLCFPGTPACKPLKQAGEEESRPTTACVTNKKPPVIDRGQYKVSSDAHPCASPSSSANHSPSNPPIVEEATDTHSQGQPVGSEIRRDDTFWLLACHITDDQEWFLQKLGCHFLDGPGPWVTNLAA